MVAVVSSRRLRIDASVKMASAESCRRDGQFSHAISRAALWRRQSIAHYSFAVGRGGPSRANSSLGKFSDEALGLFQEFVKSQQHNSQK